MDSYDASACGEQYAEIYDEWISAYDEAEITTLAELADGGRALELGIGTGRIAIPLALAGVKVSGIDASHSMVRKLRAKPHGDEIPITIGNFADVAVEGDFSLIFVALNTFFLLPSQEEQVRCFSNAARRLSERGTLVIEAFVPDLTPFSQGQSVRAARVGEHEVRLDLEHHDSVNQLFKRQQVFIREDGIRMCPLQFRYAWPSELDLMAQIAGLRLRHRWAGWQREAFTSQSEMHISVYERPAR